MNNQLPRSLLRFASEQRRAGEQVDREPEVHPRETACAAAAAGCPCTKPSRRNAISVWMPTMMARPIACSDRIVVYAKMEGDSRTHTAYALFSIASNIEPRQRNQRPCAMAPLRSRRASRPLSASVGRSGLTTSIVRTPAATSEPSAMIIETVGMPRSRCEQRCRRDSARAPTRRGRRRPRSPCRTRARASGTPSRTSRTCPVMAPFVKKPAAMQIRISCADRPARGRTTSPSPSTPASRRS